MRVGLLGSLEVTVGGEPDDVGGDAADALTELLGGASP